MVNDQLSDRQRFDLSLRGHVTGLILAGGRGGGKTVAMKHAILAHCVDRGVHGRPVVFRESWGALTELMSDVFELCLAAFPSGVERNKSEGTISLPNGALIQFSNIGEEKSYARLQGRNFSGMFSDEVGDYTPQAFAFMNRVRSNLRVPEGQKPEILWTANPHGRSHSFLFKNYIGRAAPYSPFVDQFGTEWLWCHSTYKDNPFIDHADYERQLRASCGGDAALADAWLKGTWSVLGGNMFDVFDTKVHILAADKIPQRIDWRFRLGGDWGTASPSVAILLGQHPNGDIVALDEVDTAYDPNDLTKGDGSTPPAWAEAISQMLLRWGIRPERIDGVMDDARGLQSDTVIKLLHSCGIHLRKPRKKDRTGGWVLLRQMLSAAKDKEGPGLYISTRCPHLIETLPEAPRGVLRPEDVDPRWQADHWLDALVYGLRDIYPLSQVTTGRVIGMY